MGILLTFMFSLNMISALILVPALSHFLLQGATSAPVRVDEAVGDDSDLAANPA